MILFRWLWQGVRFVAWLAWSLFRAIIETLTPL